MPPQNGTTIDLTVTSESDPMSVDNADDELFIVRETIETPKPFYQPDYATSSYSSSNPRTALTSARYPSVALPAALTSFSKSHNNI